MIVNKLNGQDLFWHRDSLIGKTITFTNKWFNEQDGYAESGMKAKIVQISDSLCIGIRVDVDFVSYRQHNLTLESPVWNRPGQHVVGSKGTATECGYYKEQDAVFIDSSEDVKEYFSLDVDAEVLMKLYQDNKRPNQSYVNWLEETVIASQTKLAANNVITN